MAAIISKKGKIFSPPGKIVSKYEIDNGMIVNFKYQKKSKDPNPIIFVLDTDIHNANSKTVSGVNLNYLPSSVVEGLFLRILGYVDWVLDETTKTWKISLKDQRNTSGKQIGIIYNNIFTSLVKKFDCYRTYKYELLPGAVYQIVYKFDSYPLNQIWLNPDANRINKNYDLQQQKDLDIDSKEVYDEDIVKKSLKAIKETKDLGNKSMIKSFKEKQEESVVKKALRKNKL
tara:strand:- start:932 stop:1621 length:690 start_codon:yes stop_codon:yes gene_type:complete